MKDVFWYNNGVKEIQIHKDAPPPDGFVRGRIPMSEESKKRMSEHSWIKGITPEKDKEKRQKISKTKQNKTEKEKLEYSKHISEARKGKGTGKDPWNKGAVGKQVAWNKGMTFKMSDEARLQMTAKQYETRKKNGTLCKKEMTGIEKRKYDELVSKYGKENVITQFYDEKRYPFKCDFYIKSEDLFIELHGNWTHGQMPYYEDDEKCVKKLKEWKEKEKTSKYYTNAIYTWTDLDVRKRETAIKNNLNFCFIYYQRDKEVQRLTNSQYD